MLVRERLFLAQTFMGNPYYVMWTLPWHLISPDWNGQLVLSVNIVSPCLSIVSVMFNKPFNTGTSERQTTLHYTCVNLISSQLNGKNSQNNPDLLKVSVYIWDHLSRIDVFIISQGGWCLHMELWSQWGDNALIGEGSDNNIFSISISWCWWSCW